MSETRAIAVYLNDHLAEASSAINLAGRMAEHHHGTDLGDVLATIVAALKEDRTTLPEIMEHLDISTSTLKQTGAWLSEKLNAVKLDDEFDGVSVNSPLSSFDFDRLLTQAQSQVESVERHWLALVPQLLIASRRGPTGSQAPAIRSDRRPAQPMVRRHQPPPTERQRSTFRHPADPPAG